MADTADLVVLGAYYGTGSKGNPRTKTFYVNCSIVNCKPIFSGGMMSVFLMGTYNQFTKQWCTVAKCGNGHDDKTLERVNKELQVVKISKVSLKMIPCCYCIARCIHR